jgi:nicotinate-nucleotide--dimethylbenzimidazole phosphoribosyltransferase
MTNDPFGVETMAHADEASGWIVEERARNVLRPVGALRRLDDLAVWLARWQRTSHPSVDRPAVIIFGGDHGVASEGVSAYPASVTTAMMDALRKGVATASVMARQVGAKLEVVDVGVGTPTGNIRVEPALSGSQFERAVETGRAAVASVDTDLLVVGEIGIGNTTSAAAISFALFGGEVSDWVGAGSGLDVDGVANKMRVVGDAVARVSGSSPVEILRELGGWELAALAGAVIEARRTSIPILLDGFAVTASVMPLEAAHPGFLDHCWPGHMSPEPGHRLLVERLSRPPILDLEMRLGEGSGAMAALPLLSLAARSVVEVATFEEWGLA